MCLCYNGTRLRYREARIFKCIGNFILRNKIYIQIMQPPHLTLLQPLCLCWISNFSPNCTFCTYIFQVHYYTSMQIFKRVVPCRERQCQEIFTSAFFMYQIPPGSLINPLSPVRFILKIPKIFAAQEAPPPVSKTPVAKFIDPWLGNKVNCGIGLSYRPDSKCSLVLWAVED